ncbi:activator of HSP90 ATPase [Actinoplanes sp. NBRC 14428]|uniref:Uncharacterized protein YndB with AHSA1/START domain n=1 Tax=Pseudosporangium ferrugineum TaxID=439699 RepID=A0A2T0SFU4_9ACTN|nr:SRPBCC family protein [Pseudosporangium ferrugineum]PRY32288.1 uncharacterized protein YndB with AHSA1/START domain [Pseudosporangium ferrugineum]BCJ49459.1 activator of HSP90 ATPase [Actinoplanes sp. NBRC 14428]
MIQVKQQISDVSRTLGTRRLEAGEARVATIVQVYDTNLDDLWDAVTSAERIPRWFVPISGDLREGGRYQLEGHAGGTVTRCDAPHAFDATWEFNNEVSWIEVRLTAEGDGRTRFQLEHTAHVTAEMWDQYGPSAVGIGWDSILLGIANNVAAPGSAITPEEAAAFVASPEGKDFLRQSADAWAEAAIAAGDDPEQARASAGRTYDLYTGAA